MHSDQLNRVPGIDTAPPATDVALAVADALLPAPLPPALVEFLLVCDGARVGALEVFTAEGITEATNEGAHSWQLPGSLVIGSTGTGRALVMSGMHDEVYEVDDESWDEGSLQLTSDSPLDLFIRHQGRELRARDRWWAYPALGGAIEQIRRSITRDAESLLAVPIGARVGEELPRWMAGFQRADVKHFGGRPLSEDFEDRLLNYRPDPPMPGLSVKFQWLEACDAIIDPVLRERVRGASVSTAIPGLDRPVGAGDRTVVDDIRSNAFLALLGKARDDLAALAEGDTGVRRSPVGRLAQVYLAGHIPVSFDVAL